MDTNEDVYPWTWMSSSSSTFRDGVKNVFQSQGIPLEHITSAALTITTKKNLQETQGEAGLKVASAKGNEPEREENSAYTPSNGSSHTSTTTSSTTAIEKVPNHHTSWESEEEMDSSGRKPRKNVIRRTQDFIFYDPNRIALHQLLDIPEDTEINPQQLLPCTALPSHHLPLLVDISFNQRFPNVGEMSLKE